MKKHLFVPIILVAVVTCLAARHMQDNRHAGPSQPNVILILADDMGWSDIGCYGSEIQTPNIDRLAARGMRFSQMYNTAKCFPSRACLLTGLYAQETGYNTNWHQPMKNAITLGEMFKTGGYTTMWAGKHHSTENPVGRGFDHYSGLMDGATNYFNPGLQREGEGKPAHKTEGRNWNIDGKIIKSYTPENKDFYTTDAFTDYALGWMDQHKTEKNPFFLYMAYNAPHEPLMAWPQDIARYRGKYKAGSEQIRKARFERQKQMGLLGKNPVLSAPAYQDWEKLSEEQKDREDLKMAVYAAMIDRIDQNIGRLLAKLKELGKDKNTMIIFTSDNGASPGELELADGSGQIGSLTQWTAVGRDWANVSNTPWRYYKGYSHEGGIRAPLVVYWPEGIKSANRISDTPLHFIDFMPTLAQVAGVKYPSHYKEESLKPLSGVSFLPLLQGKELVRGNPLFWEWSKGKAIREGDWKLVAYKDKWELFDLKADPIEAHDLSLSNPEKLEELRQKYQLWWGKFNQNPKNKATAADND